MNDIPHARRAPGLLITALVALAALAAAYLSLLDARAAGGVPLPTEAGSRWEIVAGYNTGTHNWNDQQDPHAIDIVRLDADTAGSAVLAPASGALSYIASDCLSIRDDAGMEHLLCHIQPVDGLRRGSQVQIGQYIGSVWPDGYGNNGGLAHIHYAVHHSRGGGYLGETVPFVGAYAIEDIELRNGDAFNLHAGVEFTSTNRPDWQAPALTRVSPADDPDAADDDHGHDHGHDHGEDDAANYPSNANSGGDSAADANVNHETSPSANQTASENHSHDHDHGGDAAASAIHGAATQPVIGGWRAIAVDRPASLAAVWSKRGSTLSALYYWDRFRQRWLTYSPNLPGGGNAGRISLSPGDAVLGAVRDDAVWLPRILHSPTPPALRLGEGWNLVSWHGHDTPTADAFAALNSLTSAFLWDNARQRYLRWTPGAPPIVNDLETIPAGATLWLHLAQPETWLQTP